MRFFLDAERQAPAAHKVYAVRAFCRTISEREWTAIFMPPRFTKLTGKEFNQYHFIVSAP
jgi:hypothetical protein